MKRFFTHKLENLLVISRIVTIHYFEFDKNYKFDGESHDFWEIVFADKEQIYCTSDDKRVLLKQGEMLFHKPNEYHTLYCDGTKAPNVFIASFECRSAAMRFFEDKVIPLKKSQIKTVYAIIEEAKKTFDIEIPNPDANRINLLPNPILGGEQSVKNRLELLLIDIMRSLTETEEGNHTFLSDDERGNKLVNDVLKHLNENVYSTVTISEICKKTSYSKAYIFRQFKNATGKSIIDYFTELKIDKAKQMMREEELSVKEISEKLGFDTPNYFSKTFKKITSYTPTAYKKRITR